MVGFDFDRALVKFANERENFLDNLSFSAGAPTRSRPPMTNPRADRLRVEEQQENIAGPGRRSPLRSVGGSIRRRISFRDMNSAKRQPSTLQRNGELGSYVWQAWEGFRLQEENLWAVGGIHLKLLLTCSSSFCADFQKTEQLQICHTSSRTSEYRS
jgi:hypothetical protein